MGSHSERFSWLFSANPNPANTSGAETTSHAPCVAPPLLPFSPHPPNVRAAVILKLFLTGGSTDQLGRSYPTKATVLYALGWWFCSARIPRPNLVGFHDSPGSRSSRFGNHWSDVTGTSFRPHNAPPLWVLHSLPQKTQVTGKWDNTLPPTRRRLKNESDELPCK